MINEIIVSLHAKLLNLESRYHSLVEPEQSISDKTRELVKAQVGELSRLHERIDGICERVDALAVRIEQIASAPAIAPDVPGFLLKDPEAQPTLTPPAAGEQSPGTEASTDAKPAAPSPDIEGAAV